MASSINSASTGVVCTVPWCEHVGTDRCYSGRGAHREFYAHEIAAARFDFRSDVGEQRVSACVDVYASTAEGDDIGVLLLFEAGKVDPPTMTPAEARQLAAALLNAADKAEELAR
jgi:hypothetical protein